ncbi:DUF6236 family protein [Streptomyces populi]|uniref:DUF6236 family protein n=1 Tax=Streptomyces populi TaxID=2058924 RepID=UPI0013A6A2A8|nr:DUF6236 family protein [Streptomyces populi]
MNDIALYYPNLSFQNTTWLKAAALYWPQIARLDLTWMIEDSPQATPLKDDDFLIDVSVSQDSIADMAESFSRLIELHEGRFVEQYGLSRRYPDIAINAAGQPTLSAEQEARLTLLHVGKFEPALLAKFIELGITQEAVHFNAARGTDFVYAMDPRLAQIYSCALAGRIAHEKHLIPVTDDPEIHSALTDFNLLSLDRSLVGGESGSVRTDEEMTGLLATLSIDAVLPETLVDIPMRKIVEVRQELGGELYSYRTYIKELAGQLTEFAQIQDRSVLEAHINHLIASEVQPKVEALERELKALKIQPVRKILSVKKEELTAPAIFGGAAHFAAGLPASLSFAVGLATFAISKVRESTSAAREAKEKSPVSYLLGLNRRLANQSW